MIEWLEFYQLPCLFKEAFGLECPVCGFQRAVIFLLKGEVYASFVTWPALLPLGSFLGLFGLRLLGLKKISVPLIKSFGFVCLIIILISYLLKLIINTY